MGVGGLGGGVEGGVWVGERTERGGEEVVEVVEDVEVEVRGRKETLEVMRVKEAVRASGGRTLAAGEGNEPRDTLQYGEEEEEEEGGVSHERGREEWTKRS